MAILGTSGILAEAEGRLGDASSSYLALQDLMSGFYLADDPTLSGMYARFHRRAGFDLQIVPGYLVLSPDVGQFDALESYYHLRVKEEGCAAAAETWEILQRAIRGGALGPLPAPDCRGVVMFSEAQTE
jgi:hypothetical protein